jgi:hypothetical protein
LTLNTDQLAAMNLLTAQNAGTLSGWATISLRTKLRAYNCYILHRFVCPSSRTMFTPDTLTWTHPSASLMYFPPALKVVEDFTMV